MANKDGSQKTIITILIILVSITIPVIITQLLFKPEIKGDDIIWAYSLPHLNAVINSLTFLILITGYVFIKAGNIRMHRNCMTAALVLGILFLISYLVYHFQVGSVGFKGQGWIRPIYFAILISHTILAAAVVPLVLITLIRALRERFDAHRRIARWTFPIWLYVSVTGVVIYLMLYGI